MTKLEFHQNMLKIFNNRYYGSIMNHSDINLFFKKYTDKNDKLLINEKYRKERKTIRMFHKRLPKITYSISCRMYNFLNDMGLEYDFSDNHIIIHYPLLYIETSDYYIRDLYFRFNPIFTYHSFSNCLSLDMGALRTTYTIEELLINLLHPHIQFNLLFDFSINICMGSTPFYQVVDDVLDYELNFYRFILYLENFLTHEHSNPYQATVNTQNLRIVNEGFTLPKNFQNFDWSKVEFEYKNIDDKQYVVPKVNNSEIEFYHQFIHCNDIYEYRIGDAVINDDAISKLASKIYNFKNMNFKFKGVKVEPKIEGDIQSSHDLSNSSKVVKIINENFKTRLQNETAYYFTDRFITAYKSGSLEAESIANKVSNETEQVSM